MNQTSNEETTETTKIQNEIKETQNSPQKTEKEKSINDPKLEKENITHQIDFVNGDIKSTIDRSLSIQINKANTKIYFTGWCDKSICIANTHDLKIIGKF